MTTRRTFLKSLTALGALGVPNFGNSWTDENHAPHLAAENNSRAFTPQRGAINRAALVARHNPVIKKLDPLAPLSVGNGEFAFTTDVTGLQTFPTSYAEAMPLCTQSQWGWHSFPLPAELQGKTLQLTEYETYGRKVGYHTRNEGQSELFNWLRQNPHRLHLGQIGLQLRRRDGGAAQISDITDNEQTLDLWRGMITSRFKFEGEIFTVTTAAHPTLDAVAVSIESAALKTGKTQVRFAFPYGSPAMQAADWTKPQLHQTAIQAQTRDGATLARTLDADRYFVTLKWNAGELKQAQPHEFLLQPANDAARLEFVAAFAEKELRAVKLPNAETVFSAATAHWENFWTTGGAIELAGSRDKRATEIERRIVLSQYLTAIQCAGSRPPQETGLTCNSWYGKFHLEMHWWHAAHFALWNRLPLLERSLGWYTQILPAARELATSQGYAGARWPKMTADDGRDSPSPVGPLLIWQQPHPIFYAELCYLTHPTRATLAAYRDVVFATADFMADFAHPDVTREHYVLGPPVIPAQENHPARATWNPTFELAYWAWALRAAQSWRARLGLKPDSRWADVIAKLSPLPARGGVYLAHENCPQTFTERNYDHPSMLGALGVLPGAGVDRETMRRTLKKVMKEWRWDETWGWDYPLTALTAARLGETGTAIDALLLPTPKNRYLPNGHNYQRPNLPCYLPGNGGLLYATALMAGGWQNAPKVHAPGFPANGAWRVRSEGLNLSLLARL